jgi:hypothetical protein
MSSVAENMRKCSGPFGCGKDLPLSDFWANEITCKVCRKARKLALQAGAAQPVRVRASRKAIPSNAPINDTPRVDYALMTYEGVPVAFEQDCSAVCLTDIWRAAGSPENNDPSKWLGQTQARELVAQYLRENPITLPEGNWTSRAGQYGGVWRPKEIALAYAQYLSPALYLACNRFVLNRSQQFTETAPTLNSDALGIINRLVDSNNAILASLGVLPRIDQNTRTTAAALSGVDMIRIKQVIRCQLYVFRLLPESPFLSIAVRKFRAPPKPGDHIIAIGRTGPDGNVHELRLADYGGKFPFQPSDYELLCVIQTDKEESEGVLLKHPMSGCASLVLTGGGRSKTFLSATSEGLKGYRALTSGYYTYETLRELFGDSAQADMFRNNN